AGGHCVEHDARTAHLQHDVRNERGDREKREQNRQQPAREAARHELCLRDVAVASAERRRARTKEVPRQNAENAVAQDVECGDTAGVGPARTTQERKRAEHSPADHEVHREQPELPVRSYVTRNTMRDASSREKPDRERRGQVHSDDAGDDLPRLHQPSSRRRVDSMSSSTRRPSTIQRTTQKKFNGSPRTSGRGPEKGSTPGQWTTNVYSAKVPMPRRTAVRCVIRGSPGRRRGPACV